MKTKKNIKKFASTHVDEYDVFFDSNRDSITIFRIDSNGNPGNFIKVNQAATELFGYTKNELLQMSVPEIEEITEEVKISRIKAILAEGKTAFETIIKDKQGNNRFVEIQTKLITYDNEPAVMNITRDITQRILIEEKQRNTQENLTTILEAIPDLLFEVGIDSKIYFFKSHRADLVAYSQDKIIGRFFKDIMPIEVTKICDEAIYEADQNGWSVGKQYALELPQGKFWFELSVSPIKNIYYENKRFIILARDITERKLAEEKLIASEKLLNQTQVITNLGSYFLDFSTRQWTSSKVLNSICGIDENCEKTMELVISIIHPDWAKIITDDLANLVTTKNTILNKEYKIVKIDSKEERWVHGMGELTYDDLGKPLTMIGSIQDITERKIAQEKLIASEKLLNQTQVIANLGSYSLNFTTGEWTSSIVLNSILGIDPDFEKNIASWTSLQHPDWVGVMTNYFSNIVKTQNTTFNKEYKIVKLDSKEERWVHGLGELTYDKQGNPLSMIGSIQDITERKIGQEKQNNSEKNYRTIFNTSTDYIFVHDFETGIILDVNDNAVKSFGYNSKNEIIGNTVEKLNSNIHPYTTENALKYIQKTINKGNQTFEWLSQRKDGSLFWNEIILKKTEIDGIPRVLAVGRDITDRKLAENELQENKDNLQSIFDSVSDAIYVIDENGTFINVNKGAEKMYQYSREELIGKNPQTVAAPGLNDLKEVNRIMQSVFENGNPESLEFWAVRKNGEIFAKEVVVNRGKHLGKDVLIVTARDISERKTAEKALRKSEEKLKNIFNLANSGIILADVEGNFLEFNDWWLKMTGYTREEYSKRKNFSMTHPNDLEKSKLWMQKIINGEIDKYQIEKRYVRKDKSVFWGELSVSAIKNKNNELTSTIGIVSNITERKLAEELLRESEEKYRGLVENSPDGIITYVSDKITYVNDEALRIVHASSSEQIIGKSVYDFVHPDSLDSVIKRMKDVVMRNNASKIAEEKLIALTGQTVYAELKAIPTVFEHKNGVQVIVHDITERKRTEDKIRQLSQAVEQSPVAIVITNTLGNMEYVNSKFIETTGYSYEEIIGNNPRILKSGHSSREEYKHFWQTLVSGNEWFGEFQNKKKDGTLYWESASISPILNSQGIITHYIAIKEDITERKLIEQQLIMAKDKAEESDRLKMAFLANMSHEIRTPMNGILGFTELLKDKSLTTDVQQDYIKIIKKSGKRMLNIINDIINISRVESGQIEVTSSETNINEQIEYLHTFFKPEALLKNIDLRLTKELDSNNNYIQTDREKLYAILTNLIKNAIKFTNEGFIEFGCERKGDYLEFFVKDSGLGISDSQQKIIFERFRQANDTLGRTHEGSGLGLAISKAYVEILGGMIWVESEEGVGSTFYFTIPYQSDYIHKEKIVIEKTSTSDNEDKEITDLKVLIVEDDSISKLLITIAVKPFSNEILKVSTGYEALEACRNNPDIDLIMMDVNMPEMGGYEATQKIREFNKDIVIIAQTANGMQSDHDKALEAGCTDYISKPINIDSLSRLIKKYFRK